MRKMQEYIAKGKQIFVGLEDSKKTWKLCIRSEGMVIHETSMPADYSNLGQYLRGRYPDCRIQVMYEAGFSGFWLHDCLTKNNIKYIVTPAHTVTQEKSKKVKTDKIDARRLARNLENKDYTACYVPDKEQREDRQINRTLVQIQKDIVATKNRIRKFFDFHGLNKGFPAGSWSATVYNRLRDFQLSGPLKVSLDTYLHILEELQRAKKVLIKELRALCEKDRYAAAVRLKQSSPGIGWLTAIRLTLEWGTLSRFPSGKHFASFTGLTSREYSTGETVHKGRITGDGSVSVRGWLIQCAWRAIRYDPVLLDKYKRVCNNSGSKKKAIVAVARKMAVRLRAMEITNQPYCVGLIS